MSSGSTEKRQRHPALRLASALANAIWWLLLVLLVLLALYAGIARQLTQNLNQYRDDVQTQLSEQLGLDVTVGSLSAEWQWLNPTLVARNLSVKPRLKPSQGEDGTPASIGSLNTLRVGIDFLASISRFRVVFSNFELNGLKAVISQSQQGDVHLQGVAPASPVAEQLESWIDLAGQWLSDPSVRITRVDLGIRDRKGVLREIEIPQLDLNYRGGIFRAAGRIMRPGTTEQLARIGLRGRGFFRGDFEGTLFLDINSGRLFDGLLDDYTWNNIRVEGFDVGGQLWVGFADGVVSYLNGILTTPYLQLGLADESLAPLENIEARFGWRPWRDTAEGSADPDPLNGEFHLSDLAWDWRGNSIPGFDARYQRTENGHLLIADDLPLGPLRELISALELLPEAARMPLNRYQPDGQLDDLRLSWPTSEGFALSATLDEVTVEAVSGAPAVRGLNGTLLVDAGGGFVLADAENMVFGFPGLFRGLWNTERFNAGVAWQFDEGVTRVFSDDIALRVNGTRLTGAFDLRMTGATDVLGLSVDVENGTAAMLADFVPVHVVNSGLYEWLQKAIPEADIAGTYYGHGRIDGNAPPGSFDSSMVYRFSQSTIKFDERWPAVREAAGEVFVHNGSTRVDLTSGSVGGVVLDKTRVLVSPTEDDVVISVTTEGDLTGPDINYWLNNSPLGEMAGTAGQSIGVEGDFALSLGLELPIVSDGSPTVRASLTATDGRLDYEPAGLSWAAINGTLSYDPINGYSPEPLTARFLDSPVSVWLSSGQSDGSLAIRQSGMLPVTRLLSQFDLEEAQAPGVSGDLAYTASLEVAADRASAVELSSQMVGVGLDWPGPLGKAAADSAPLRVTVAATDNDGLQLEVDWLQRLSMVMNAPLNEGDWVFDIRELNLTGRTFKDLTLKATPSDEAVTVTGRADWLEGTLEWPLDNGAAHLNVGRLALPESPEKEELEAEQGSANGKADEAPGERLKTLDTASWPVINVDLRNLKEGDQSLGDWAFVLVPGENRLGLESFSASLEGLLINGEGYWHLQDGREQSAFKGTLTGGSLSVLSRVFGSEIPLTNEKTHLEMSLSWPGPPDQFALERLNGQASVRLEDGVILEGNRTAQLFKIFGLLNADTVWRRLKLDFSDIYESGVAFDAMSGSWKMEDGLLTLTPELQIVGPSGAFKFSGKTDMANETLDMTMVVVLPLTQNLPLAALLLGASAPIGGALFVLDKVLGDPLSKLTSATYSVKGNWSNPKVRLKQVFDRGE